ncbi:hypothetical protein B0181_08290 [Moraxella caviae]|uniref:Uncharacterized protein n=1 Tax=Moraxella caviae TaxID=34060 RepID=A0A1S9ZY96_9GAMM|nr:hypothetical protein B0181_08290 [Moraxella caviae]
MTKNRHGLKTHHEWFSYGFPMVFLWFSYGFGMVFQYFFKSFLMVLFNNFFKVFQSIKPCKQPPKFKNTIKKQPHLLARLFC